MIDQKTEEYFEKMAREAGWTTIEEFGWDGTLICHKDHGEERDGREYGSWEACCVGEWLVVEA
jgi:hypothetical protein